MSNAKSLTQLRAEWEAARRAAFTPSWRCEQCRVPEHDTCSLTPGCHCCEETLAQMAEEG